MASDSSFDVVSKLDRQEVDNAVNQTAKEISQRYDFRGVDAGVHAAEVIALGDLLGGLVDGVVHLLAIQLGDDVKGGVRGHVRPVLSVGEVSAGARPADLAKAAAAVGQAVSRVLRVRLASRVPGLLFFHGTEQRSPDR